ncbi:MULTISPECIES: NAD kinase [unclassified Dysgonomonas]|uniref:NAD kinase n=1 Tax=unclassified Dysgonomonas TaxID=2630389 RepID=UPI0013EB93B7|nr:MULTISPECIES: NAD kinase [unclassified Dysgonomonas]
MKIAIFGSRHQKLEQIERIFNILLENRVEIYVQDRFYEYLSTGFGLQYDVAGIFNGEDFSADMAISIGGDGTFLRTASAIGKKDIPIFGINTGRLGFLADVTDEELDCALADILAGKYRIENRNQLQLSTNEKAFHGFNYALNEIAILKQDTASMITLHAYINDEYLTSYEADGLIIATPTGSTAYSLSVGGPIMTPTSSSFIIAPVAPHSLSARPLVVDNHCVITLEVESRSDSFLISLDGRSNVFSTGTKLHIKKADFTLKVVKRLGHTFYGTLRDKLMWGVDPRQ